METSGTTAFKSMPLSSVKEEVGARTLLQQQQTKTSKEIDEISLDADVSDEYGSVSDSSSSLDKFDGFLNKTETLLNSAPSQEITTNKQQMSKNQLNSCKEIWRRADAVCFDVDSTVCCDEAIDELAKYVGKTKEVSEITKTAMLGGVNFRDALAQRLDIIQPNTQILAEYLKTHKPRLTPHIEELIARLHQLGRDVYLISGGFDVIIQPAGEILNIPMENIFANSIKFYFDGSYAGFDKSRPTSNQDGKSRVIAMLKRTKCYKNVVMIGDGVTDLEACPPADAFIGFGGNQIRETVRGNADWFVYSFKELITELPFSNNDIN